MSSKAQVSPTMQEKKRIHNSSAMMTTLESRKYIQSRGTKPRGLWYGFGDAWKDWCRSEMPEWVKPYDYEISVDGANILALRTETDMIAFRDEYQAALAGLSEMRMMRGIDWPRVAGKYDGIEIPEYFWQFRLHRDFFWYYGWDCASGCAWNIERLKVALHPLTERSGALALRQEQGEEKK